MLILTNVQLCQSPGKWLILFCTVTQIFSTVVQKCDAIQEKFFTKLQQKSLTIPTRRLNITWTPRHNMTMRQSLNYQMLQRKKQII